jgi:ubiquinone/menaquinone biosynthesis C-methylase UbiE
MPQSVRLQLISIHNSQFSIHPLRKSNFLSLSLKELVMRKSFVNCLKCSCCGGKSFDVAIEKQNDTEIREGYVACNACQSKFVISKGVLNFLVNPRPVVEEGQKGWMNYDLLPNALPFKVEDAHQYEKQILMLPEGDDSNLFKRETLLRNINKAKHAFYHGLSLSGLTGNEKLLDLGADICWSTHKFAQLGCQCVALDINHHLPVSDVYIYRNNVYFERILADMSELHFDDESFDIVVTVTSIHHTPDLSKTFKEIARVLNPNGKLVLINEPLRGIFKAEEFGNELEKKFALNDQWYTAHQYYTAAKKVGLKLFFKLCLRPITPSDSLWKKMIKSFVEKNHWMSKSVNFPKSILQLIPGDSTMIAFKRKN